MRDQPAASQQSPVPILRRASQRVNGRSNLGRFMTNDETQATAESGIVYAATNPMMPGLVKIGGTSRANVQARMDELYSTGVPVPFTCAIARRVDRYLEVESALHTVFEPSRVSPGREFFRGDPRSGGCGAWTWPVEKM